MRTRVPGKDELTPQFDFSQSPGGVDAAVSAKQRELPGHQLWRRTQCHPLFWVEPRRPLNVQSRDPGSVQLESKVLKLPSPREQFKQLRGACFIVPNSRRQYCSAKKGLETKVTMLYCRPNWGV